MTELVLGSRPLTRRDYEEVVYGGASVSPPDGSRVGFHRAVLDRQLQAGAVIYSVTTGYGAEATQPVAGEALGRMQENTVRSHAIGVGDAVPESVVRGALLLIANAAAQGPPGLRPEVVSAMVELLRSGPLPSVPELGSQSASDLIPAAHLALAVLDAGVSFQAKDGSIVNNSAFTTALAVEAVRGVERLIDRAEQVAALTLQAVLGHVDAYDERLIRLRPHPGALRSAAHMRELLDGSNLLRGPGRPHDPFSLRCLPQIHGAARDAVTHAADAVEIDIAAVTDNPVVIAEDATVLSGGNFHGLPLALPLDGVGLAVAQIAALSQRRTQHLVNRDLAGMITPVKLTPRPAERLGMLMLPSLAAALVSECRLRTQPASRESIPVDVMEDHVAMSALAARQVLAGTLLARRAVAAELAAAAQALDFHDVQRASPPARALHEQVRERLAFLDEDRPVDVDLVLDLV